MRIDTAIAANRFGLGARPGDLARIDGGHRTWLLDQLEGPSRAPALLRDLPGTPAIAVEIDALRDVRRAARRQGEDAPAPDAVKKYAASVRRHYLEATHARYANAAATDYPFHERLVHFWSNHFAVSADKQPLPALAGAFENEAIRPNLGGRFVDLLMAAEKHPAMIVYLDNQQSIGPKSKLGKRAARNRRKRAFGLNENLAREILELHTLGVNGGYTQEDVTAFANVLTGWSMGGGRQRRFKEGIPGTFEFREAIHEPGAQRILGQRYAQKNVEQGEAVLRDLATHEATAHHLATKLVRHFVADDPPAELVTRIARVFVDSGGDLPTVHAALVQAEEPWRQTLTKYKTPQDFVVSALRAFSRVPENGRFVFAALEMMGQAPYRPGSPAGWPDTAAHWGGADAVYKRIEWSSTVAHYAGERADPMALGEATLGPALSARTKTAIARAESVEQATTLLLASPDFQRR